MIKVLVKVLRDSGDAILGHLDKSKCKQLAELIQSYPGLFSDTPTGTHLIEHDVDVGDARPITQQFYQVFPEKRSWTHGVIHVG